MTDDTTPSTAMERAAATYSDLVFTPSPSRVPAKADTDSWVEVIRPVSIFAAQIAATSFVPSSLRGNPAAVTAAIVAGREAGLPPMAALTQTYIVNGTPSLSAKAKRALVLAAGHELQVVEATGALARVRGRRRGADEWSGEVVWTIEMARAAGLTSKDNWKAHPRQMLVARATGELIDRDFPDVVFGFETAEQLRDDADSDVDAGGAAEPAVPSTRVARKAPARKSAKSRPAPGAERPRGEQGPPLPGEDGSDGAQPAAPAPEPSAADSVPPPPEPDAASPAPPDPADAGVQVDEIKARRSGRSMTKPQRRMLFSRLGALGVSTSDDDRAERLRIVAALVGRPVDSTNELTYGEAETLLDTLARLKDRAQLDALIESGVVPDEPPAPEPDDPDDAVDPDADRDVVDAELVDESDPEPGADQ